MLKSTSVGLNKTYVGYTKNIKNRLTKHNSNKGAKSTKGHKWILIFKKRFNTKNEATVSYTHLTLPTKRIV